MPKRALLIVGVLIAILLLAALSLPFLVNANEFRPRIEAAATSAVGRKVSLGDLSFSIFPAASKRRISPSPTTRGSAPSPSCAPNPWRWA